MELISDIQNKHSDVPTVLSCSVGPRADAYAPKSYMTVAEAERYHSEQIGSVVDTDVDMVGAYTLCYPEEAIGIVRAARHAEVSVVIGFTVENDGASPH